MELTTLNIFLQVSQCKSLSKAAISLGMAQSHVSTKIQQIEKELCTELLVRHNKGVELTGAGEILADYAQRILRLVNDAEKTLHAGASHGSLRISAMQSTAQSFLPAMLSEFHQAYPDYRIRMLSGNALTNIDRVLRYECDFAYVAGDVNSAELACLRLTEERMVVVCDRHLSSIEQYFQEDDASVVAFPSGCAYRRHFEEYLSEHGIVPKNVIEYDSIPAILASVCAGMGVAALPGHIINSQVQEGVLCSHELPDNFSFIPLNLCYRNNLKLNEAMQLFIKINQKM